MTDRGYGPLNQTAYVVPDIEAAIDWWTGVMRVGPFFRFGTIQFANADYRGSPEPPVYKAAVAYSGELMVELIEPGGPSIFQEFLDSGRTGVQHIAAFADDMEAARAAVEARGGVCVQSGGFDDGSRIAYFEMGGPSRPVLEIAALSPAVLELFASIKAAGAAWDGVTRTVDL